MRRAVLCVVLLVGLAAAGWVGLPTAAQPGTTAPADADDPALTPQRPLFGNPDAQAARWVQQHPDDPRAATLAPLTEQPVARWFTGPVDEVRDDVADVVDAAAAAGATPVLVAYAIPDRDCGQFSAGGAADAATYRAWIDAFARSIGPRKAVVVLEPDALVHTGCLDDAGLRDREELLAGAIATLAALAPQAEVYLDGSAANWSIDPAALVDRLLAVGVEHVRGLALGVSSYTPTATAVEFGRAAAADLAGRTGQQLGLVVDTSRNGVGTTDWCNPADQRLGQAPTTDPGLGPDVDALLWIKPPGESDGDCGTGPGTVAGQFDPGLAAALVG
ncbi:endoglucanase [Klenkia soli]|uniref:Glucanase n=1 Tax=Klenkia soli TaxID=1052260 RepID=A0A1H0SCX3_9ACTN|nr:glycoside hydrolase family 6 protein [Klenkia soli]SDP39537.1 endoglucanase [Klenkia soli]